jgi:hypothetical protein
MAVSNEQKMLKERIRGLLAMRKMTASDLGETENEKKIYQRQILGESLVTFDTISKLLYMFHWLSAEWLVRGEGSMDRASEVAPKYYTINHNNNNHDNGIVNIGADMSVTEQVADLRRQLEEVTKDRELLKGLLEAITKKQ